MPRRLLMHRHAGWLPWVLLLLVVLALVVRAPTRRTVTPVYHGACEAFWHGQDLYGEGIHGFLYLPVNAWAFTPFHALGDLAGDLLWRAVGLALLALAVLRLSRAHGAAAWPSVFLGASLLAIPGLWSAARNGQANLPLTALLVHAALDAGEGRWTRGALGFVLALAVKPLALVPLLLFGALEPRLRWRLLAGLAVLCALPFLHPDPGYVWRQHAAAWAMLRRAGAPGVPYTEVFGGLAWIGIATPAWLRLVVRALLGLLVLGLAWRARRRRGRAVGALDALGLAVAYLVAFNPRSEANSYVLLAAVAAPCAAAAWCAGRRVQGGLLGASCLLLATHFEPNRLVDVATKRWLKPLLALGFGAWTALRGGRAGESAP